MRTEADKREPTTRLGFIFQFNFVFRTWIWESKINYSPIPCFEQMDLLLGFLCAQPIVGIQAKGNPHLLFL